MFQENPKLAVQLDFTLQEHQLARQQLINEGFTNDQAACSLAALWTLANNADKEQWNLRQECLQEVREWEEEEEEQRQQVHWEEAEAVCLEDRKKNKNKYALLVCGKLPLTLPYYWLNTPHESSKLEIIVSFTISRTEAYRMRNWPL